jgi:hypothetical protein
LSARHDVEGEVYSRLYGPATALGRERSGMLGADDPSLEASHPGEVDARAGRRGRGWRAAVRARARAWLATGSLRSAPRRGSVVAPRPSLARAVALLALGAALLVTAALGAILPDPVTEGTPDGTRATSPKATERGLASTPARRRGDEATARRDERRRAARRARHAKTSSAAGPRAHSTRRERPASGSGQASRATPTERSSARAAPAAVVCSGGGECVVSGDGAGGARPRGRVVVIGRPDASVTHAGRGASGAYDRSPGGSSTSGAQTGGGRVVIQSQAP